MRQHVPPPGPGFTLEETPRGPLVIIRAERNGCVLAFLGVWLLGWAAGEASAIKALGDVGFNLLGLFLIVWLLGWSAGGLAAMTYAALMLDGTEIIALDGQRLVRRIQAFGIGHDWAYDLAQIRNLRADEAHAHDSPTPVLRFDYGSASVDLAKGLSALEAERLAEELLRRYPSMR